jgi:SAM-dependent methyltransferase
MSDQVRECPLCENTNFLPLLKARDFHYGNPGEYQLIQCGRCSLAFLDPMYEDHELSNFYPKNYYAFVDRFSAKPSNFLWTFARTLLVGHRDHPTKDPQFEKPGRMLDVGCGSGWFISQMREQGWRVTGVEPNAAAADFGRTEKGLDIFPGSLLDAAFPDKSFDYVRLNHSFEHMNDPNRILKELRRILADDGKLMIGVPNRAGWNARIFGAYWWHLALPLHTFSYSTQTLSQMLDKHGFDVHKIEFNTEKLAIQGSLQMYLNRKNPSLGTQGWVANSRLIRIAATSLARIQNALGVADAIEITATKSIDVRR